MIYTKVVVDMNEPLPGGRFVILESISKEYDGPVDLCKGPSQAQKDLQAKQSQFYDTLQKNYEQQFANQNNVLSAIKAVYDPILAAGPGQFGFTKPEETALRTEASDATAQNYAMAQKSANERFAAQSGNTFVPSGAQADIDAKIAGAAAESESNKQLGITTSGYDAGRQLFAQATSAESGAAGMYNPLGYAGSANSAGNDAFNSATEIAKMGGGFWGTVGGLLGGAAGSFLGPMGTAVGSKLGSSIGGAASGGGGGDFV